MHVRFESLYISLPSSAKQQREMIKFYVFWRTRTTTANFGIFFWKWSLSVHVWPEQIFRPIGVLNRFTELRNSKAESKFIFFKASNLPSPSSLLKLPIVLCTTALDFREKNRACFESIGARVCSQSPTLPLYYEGKMMKTIFLQNYVFVLRTTTTRHMVSFIDFYFHFLANFQT